MILFTKGMELTTFGHLKNSNDVLNKFKSKNFQASKLSTYDFSTLYTTLPHHLIKDKLIDLINRTFIRKNTQYLACNEECAFFTSDVYNNHNLWSCQKVCDALVYLLDNIFSRFATKLYRQTAGILMGTNCAPLVADLFLFLLWGRFHEVSLTWKSGWHYWGFQFNFKIPWRFNKNFKDLLWPNGGPDIPYRTPIKWSKFFRYRAPFLDLCISNGTISTKLYDKRDDFDFDIVNFPFLDGDVPRRTSYGVYISQLIRFARASSNLNAFNYRNKALTAKFLRQGYRYFKLRKAFSKFYRRHSALLEKYSVSLKALLQQGISEPEFYGDLVYRFRKIVGKSNFSEQFRKLINRYKRIDISLDIMRQTACLVVKPIIVDDYASLFNCTTTVRASDLMTASS